jgi:hypothetical protein
MLSVAETSVDNSNSPGTAHLTDEQRIDWLRLIRSDRVGPHGIMAQTPLDQKNQSFRPSTAHS